MGGVFLAVLVMERVCLHGNGLVPQTMALWKRRKCVRKRRVWPQGYDLEQGSDLEDGSVVEQGQQLQQVVEDVAVLLLHPQDVGGVERLGAVHLQLLVEREKAKLEEVLDDDGDLRTQRTGEGTGNRQVRDR